MLQLFNAPLTKGIQMGSLCNGFYHPQKLKKTRNFDHAMWIQM